MSGKLKYLLLAALAVMLFAGCSNIALNDASAEGSDAAKKCYLTIGLKDSESIMFQSTANSISRTIDPGKYDVDSNTTTYKIEGFSARNAKLPLTAVTFDNTHKAEDAVALEYDVWYLTLHAYNAAGKEILRGVTSVDLTKAVAEIEFELSTKGVPTEGGLALTVKGVTTAVKSYKAGLYNINTDTLEVLLADENLAAPADISITKDITTDPVAPGSYIFKFIPYNDTKENASSREDLTPWSDIITIAPGRTTTKTVTITVMQAPAAPSGFTASLVDASEDDKDDMYTVLLEWTDNSVNEENFVLRIYESDGTEADLDAIYAKSPVAEFDKDFYRFDNAYWVSGTLGMSTKSCEIKLPTGHLYEMTLSAKNRAGESAACSRGSSASFADTVRVNRQKITYNLMGGTYTEDATAATPVPSTDNIVDYVTYNGTATAIEAIAAPATLVYNDHPWTKWVTLPNGSVEITVAPDYKDIMVYASYNLNVNLKFNVADEYKTLVVTAACSASGAVYTAASSKLELDVTNNPTVTGGNITFTIADTDKAGNALPVCDKIILLVNGNVAGARDNEMVYNYSLNNFKTSGVYNITVIGEIGGTYYSGDPIALTVDIK